MTIANFNIKGLTQKEVLLAREKHGKNSLNFKKESGFLSAVKSLLKDPMIILLLVASSIYFISCKNHGFYRFNCRKHIFNLGEPLILLFHFYRDEIQK